MKKITIKRMARYMSIVRVTGHYQVTIPAEIRKVFNVNKGDYVEFKLKKLRGAWLKPVEVIVKKTKQMKRRDAEDEAWRRLAQEQFLKGYDEKDAAYDQV